MPKQPIYRISVRTPEHIAQNTHHVKEASSALLKVIKDIDLHLKKGSDNGAIFNLEEAITGFKKGKQEVSQKLQFRLETFSDLVDRLASQPGSRKLHDFKIPILKQCVSSFEGILHSLYKKKALILLEIFSKEELEDPLKQGNISYILKHLNVSDEKKDEVKKLALCLAEEIELRKNGYIIIYSTPQGLISNELSEEERKKPVSFMEDEYIWYLKRLGFNDPQIEEQAGKVNGRTIDRWADDLKKDLSHTIEAVSISAQRAKLKLIPPTNDNGAVKPKESTTTESPPLKNHNPLKKVSPGEVKHLDEISRDKLICETYNMVAHHPIPDYKDFLEQVLKELNKQRAFRELNFSTDQLMNLLEEKFSLTERHYKITQTYKELVKKEGEPKVTEEMLGNALGKTDGLDLDIEAINDSEVYAIEFPFKPSINTTLYEDIVSLQIPLFDEIGIQYGSKLRFPSYHQVAIKYTDIDDPDKSEALHASFHNYNMKKIIDVVLIDKNGTAKSKTLPTAECRLIAKQLKGNNPIL